MFSLFDEYSNLEYVHVYVICKVIQAEYGIRIRMAASQEYVNTYSTRRVAGGEWREGVSGQCRTVQGQEKGPRVKDGTDERSGGEWAGQGG